MAFLGLSDLQLGIGAIGAGFLAAVFAFNKWQERRHRKTAEKAFTSTHHDVLLEPGEHAAAPPVEQNLRIEPGDDTAQIPLPPPISPTTGVQRVGPKLPSDVDPHFDCIGTFESIDTLEANKLWLTQAQLLQNVDQEIRWFGFDDASNLWCPLNAHSGGAYHWYCAAISLATRRGPLSERDAAHFLTGFQQLADAFMSLPTALPTRAETLIQAEKLDTKCAEMDIQVGINVVANSGRFDGPRIYEAAQQMGLLLKEDGVFHAQDAFGHTLYTVQNVESVHFSRENIDQINTPCLTLIIDVPHVSEGEKVFDTLLATAQKLARVLNGRVVDDNGSHVSTELSTRIRSTIQHYQRKLQDANIPAGSARARRVFMN